MFCLTMKPGHTELFETQLHFPNKVPLSTHGHYTQQPSSESGPILFIHPFKAEFFKTHLTVLIWY